jgi:hypothetical protein
MSPAACNSEKKLFQLPKYKNHLRQIINATHLTLRQKANALPQQTNPSVELVNSPLGEWGWNLTTL